MATREERKSLLAVRCNWCGAEPGEECFTQVGKFRRPITTLDGAAHETRWLTALSHEASTLPVLQCIG